MAKRGVPFHPDSEQAFQMALKRIRKYKGSQPVFDEATRLMVQGIVIDALVIAPQPVTEGWVHTTLMTVGRLVRWARTNSEPLEREHLLDLHTRNRFLNLGLGHMEDTSVRNYRTRLDLIATALSGVPVGPATTRKLSKGEPVDPLTSSEVATLWVWALGLRPITRRQRVVASIVLGLGCGLRSSEHVRVGTEDVTVDADGVHVLVHGDHGDRLVTCDQAWEERLLDLLVATPAGHLLNSPWRTMPASGPGLLNAIREAQAAYPPPVRFSPRSLRNTWLVSRLEAAAVPTLMEAAGVETLEALRPFLGLVAKPSPAARATSLRGNFGGAR
ncbi:MULTISPECIES: hypothetical protein [unclassified Nocardioides]|uniref:hypothetical protein n=1 Tax=unclassified Nocardioides TaxID=2615069 RepID=UPI003606FAD0